jgi:serine/threonine protein kinase
MSSEQHPDRSAGEGSVDPSSVEGLFVAALGKSTAEERKKFLDEACGQDAERRRRVEALLRAYNDAGSFLDKPALATAGTVQGEQSVDDEIRPFLAPTDAPGRMGLLGPYEIIDVIGRGGMGIVLRGFDPRLSRVVAIKVLAPELAANPMARQRFMREAKAAAAVSHPHVVTIHAVEDGSNPSTLDPRPSTLPFLVMECIAGQSLQQKLDKVGTLRLTEILRIGRQVAEGLAAAHKQGVVHRDIKPANILLENGVERVKITDFGLARVGQETAITRTGEVSGTPQYMSPEQAKGERVDHRSDLFSLGGVLYAMCTGRAPFRAEGMAGIINRVINDEPRPIPELNPEVPDWLCGLIAGLLAKDPDDRPQTAGDVVESLEAELAQVQSHVPRERNRQRHGVTHPQSGVGAPTADWSRPVGTILAACGALALGLSVLGLIAGSASGREPMGLGFSEIVWFGVMSLLFLIAGAVLRQGSLSPQALLIVLFLTLGPLGVVIWLLRPERLRELAGAPQARALRPATHRAPAWIAPALVVSGIATVSFAITRHLRVQDQFVFLAAVVAVATVLIAWLIQALAGRGMQRPVGFPVVPLMIAALWLGGMAGAPDGLNWLHDLTTPVGCLLVFLFGSAAILCGMLLYERRAAPVERPWRDRAHSALGQPGKILAWMGIIVLSLVLLVPCVIGIGLAVPWYFALQSPRPQAQPTITQPHGGSFLQSSGAEGWSSSPTTVENGALLLEMADEGLTLILSADVQTVPALPREALGGPRFTSGGTHEVAPGTYVPIVCDRLLGWAQPEAGTAGAMEMGTYGGDMMMGMGGTMGGAGGGGSCGVYRLPSITIEPGVFHPLTIRRDPMLLAANAPDWREDRLHRFLWYGTEYVLSGPQAKVVQRLFEACAAGTPDVAEGELVAPPGEGALPGTSEPASSVDAPSAMAVFNDGKHPAWGTLIVPGEAEGTYRLAAPPEGAAGGQPSSSEGFPVTPAAGMPGDFGPTLTVNREPNVSTDNREAQVTVDLRDTGLFVALRRRSSFSGEKIGDEETVAELGPSTLLLANGSYEVLLRDQRFGWNVARTTAVEIPAGAVMTLVASRDLARYAPPAVDDPLELATRDGIRFLWNGKGYRVTPAQAACVNLLLRRSGEGTLTATEDELKAAALTVVAPDREADPGATVEGVLRNVHDIERPESPGAETPAGDDLFGSLIVRDEAQGTYRLAPADVARCRIEARHDWLTATVTHPVTGERVSFSGVGAIEYVMTAGAVSVVIGDDAAGWSQGQAYSGANFGAPQFSIDAQREGWFNVVASRDAEYFRQMATAEAPESASDIHFRWFDRSILLAQNPGGGAFVGRPYAVNADQAACIKVLLRALADGSPVMAEQEIISAAKIEGRTFADVFSLALDENKDRWTGLLSPGEREGTWQLTPPPDEMVDLGPETATLDRLIQLAEQNLQAAEARHKSGFSSTGELQEARGKLAEAKLRRAEQRADTDLRRRLLEEILTIRREQLETVQKLHETGRVPPSAVREAEAAVLEAQSRLEAVIPSDAPAAGTSVE